MSTTIEDRLILLLREISNEKENEVDVATREFLGTTRKNLGGHGFWENLERETQVSSQRWRKTYARRQRPTPDMIEAISQMLPEYAFWLVTGITDGTNGHVAPQTAQIFPERLYLPSDETNTYFRCEIELFKRLFKEGQVNTDDEKERLAAAERTRPMYDWWDSPLCETAYQLASTSDYKRLQKTWNKREDERKKRVSFIAEPSNRPWVKDQPPWPKPRRFDTDPRTKHQDNWDLYYLPPEKKPTKSKI